MRNASTPARLPARNRSTVRVLTLGLRVVLGDEMNSAFSTGGAGVGIATLQVSTASVIGELHDALKLLLTLELAVHESTDPSQDNAVSFVLMNTLQTVHHAL